MRIRSQRLLVLALLLGVGVAAGKRIVAKRSSGHAQTAAGAAAPLTDIVGEWQSDTTGGVSARSACAWTPDRLAVVCDQRVARAGGVDEASNVFASRPSAGAFVYYAIPHDGAAIQPVPLAIANHIWTYGGGVRAGDGTYSRTVNDFSASGSYTWRQESSTDGEHWTAGMHGKSTRVR